MDDLHKRLPDAFSKMLLDGALSAAADNKNPVRGNSFAAVMRELMGYLLESRAPDDRVKSCTWFRPERENGEPTRAQRQRYLIQGGLSDQYVSDELNLEPDELRTELRDAFEALHRAAHVRPNTVIASDADVSGLMTSTLAALTALLDAIDHCRSQLMEAAADALSEEATEAVLYETIQTIDEKASGHSIDEVDVETIETTDIDVNYIWYKVTGTIGAELYYGSADDGATIDHAFPFSCVLAAPVDDPQAFDADLTMLTVDDGGWYDDRDEY